MMDIKSKKVQNAGASDLQSLGSYQYSSGRFPKVSIGITVEKLPKIGSGARNEDSPALLQKDKLSSLNGNIIENGGQGKAPISDEKQKETSQRSGAWISPRSLCHETPTIKTNQFFANHTSVVESDGVVHRKLDTFAYGKKMDKTGNVATVEEVGCATTQEMHVLDKGIGCDKSTKATCDNEALRLKLWEILGCAPSQNKETISSPRPEANSQNLKLKQSRDCMGGVVKPKQNSDPIETDSDSPNQTLKRPVTRSSTRKRVSSKPGIVLQRVISSHKKPLSSSGSKYKSRTGKKNVFAFNEGGKKAASRDWAVNGNSSSSNTKKSQTKGVNVDSKRFDLTSGLVSKFNLDVKERKQNISSADRDPQSKEPSNSPCQPVEPRKDALQTPNTSPEDAQRSETKKQSPLVKNTLTPGVIDSPLPDSRTPCSENLESPMPKCDFVSPLLARNMNDFQSPTLAMDDSSSPPLARRKLLDKDLFNSEGAGQRATTRRMCSSDRLNNFKARSGGLESYGESSDEAGESDQLSDSESPTILKEAETEQPFSLSPGRKHAMQDFGAELTDKGFTGFSKWHSDADSPQKSPFTLRSRKRVHGLEGIEISKRCSPSSAAIPRSEETTGSLGASEQYPENSLARAVVQLAIVLERLKTKIKSKTSTKCSEILSSAADKIQLELQVAESRIREDLGKLNHVSKSKRKRLESTFEEQKETLRNIHEKFKKEVNQQLAEYSRNLQEMKAYQIELKGSVEQQKGSHKKLIAQVEEASKVQLSDAEKRIAAIQEESRVKFNCIKRVLKEWMEDGDLG